MATNQNEEFVQLLIFMLGAGRSVKIEPFDCQGNQSKSAIWIKFIWLVEDYSKNITVKLFVKISAVTQK